MLYFHLNNTNFIDPMIHGEKNNIGIIEIFFINYVFSMLSDAKVYMGSWSKSPQFTDMPTLKEKDWILLSVDNESFETPIEDILATMEQSHSIKIPQIGKSLSDMGLHYDYVANVSNKNINYAWNDYMAENNLQYLEESVGNRTMTLSEKIDFLSSELINIKSKGNLLTIVDPYIFPKKHDADYVDLFLGIIKKAAVSSVKIITNPKNCDAALRKLIETKLPVSISVYGDNNLHDRWWIIENEKKAIACGPSLNGIGNGKLSTIAILPEIDVDEIIKYVGQILQKI